MIFEITPEHIEALSDADLRTLVGYLAEQEAIRAGHSAAGVTYGGHQNAKDGGIDVRVDLGKETIKGYIPRSQTGFQVKAEDMPQGAIEAEMRPGDKLRPAIAELGEAGGSYIIVSSKGTVSDTFLSKRRNAMAEFIADEPRASGLHLDFYDRRRIASWANQHPGLIPWIRNRVGASLSGWRPYEDWSSSPGTVEEKYLTDDHVRIVGVRLKDTDGIGVVSGIEKLREILSVPKGAVRLVGLSGVGKTRLVQALFDETIGSNALNPRLAVYADLADAPDPVPLELLDCLLHLGQRCVLIIDNCGMELHRKLCARMKNAQGAVSVITVEYDISDDEPENTDTFKLEPASGEIIEKIVARRYPGLSGPEIGIIAEFSEGNSRIALALAETAQNGGSLANLQDSGLIKRLFHQNHQENPALLQAAKACSLVYSFDGETLEGDEAELPRLAALAGQTVNEFHAHVAELHRRQLVQKRSKWRALLPHALAHKLAKQALQDFPPEQVRTQLVDGASERFLKSFSRRLGCLHDSKEAQAIASDWLKPEGWLEKIEELNELGLTLLDNIAPVNPGAVLAAIEAAMKRHPEPLAGSRDEDRIISLLRSLAYDPELFDKAAMLIADLARDDSPSNNMSEAINVFKSLFFIYLSGTHAPAVQRARLLRVLASSDHPRREALVMAGLDAMLECNHFTSGYRFEFGTRKRDYGFHPRSQDEYWDWYRQALSLAGDLSAIPEFREPVRKMVGTQFRFLAPGTGLTDELIALADRFAGDGGWPQGWAGARGAARAAAKAKRKADADKLRALANRLKPGSLKERISSYVLPEQWGALDIAEIDLDDDKRYEKARQQVDKVCEEIGKDLANDPAALAAHLPDMLKSKSMRVQIVAAAIGRESKIPEEIWSVIVAEILSPAHNGQVFGFPGNFLSGLGAVNKTLANTLLDTAFENPALHPFFIYMQIMVGVDKAASERIVEAASLPTVPTHSFTHLAYGRACDELPSPDFRRVILAIAGRDDGLDAAFEILNMRLFSRRSDKKPLDPEEKSAGRALLGMVTFEKKKQREGHILADVVRKCLSSPADDTVVRQLCEKFLDGLSSWAVHAWDYGDLVAEIGASFPRAFLDILVERGSIAMEGRRSIFGSFRERRPCPLRKIPEDAMLEWAHEKPETRFIQLAEAIRPWQSARTGASNDNESEDYTGPLRWNPVALRILHESPEPLEVLKEFLEGFRPSAWSGSLATILEARAPLIEELTRDANKSIAEAAAEALGRFKEQIEKAREWEAGESRERDERFEW